MQEILGDFMGVVFDSGANQLLTGIACLDSFEMSHGMTYTQDTVVAAAQLAAESEISFYVSKVVELNGGDTSSPLSHPAKLFLIRDLFANGIRYGVFPSAKLHIREETAKAMSDVVRRGIEIYGPTSAMPTFPHVRIDLENPGDALEKVNLLIEFGGFLCYKEAIRILEEFRCAKNPLDLGVKPVDMASPLVSYFGNIAEPGWMIMSIVFASLGVGILAGAFWVEELKWQLFTGVFGLGFLSAGLHELRWLWKIRGELLPIS